MIKQLHITSYNIIFFDKPRKLQRVLNISTHVMFMDILSFYFLIFT